MYDTASDQRRTTALKQTIEGLRTETQNLKDIIVSLCTSTNRDALIRVVHDNLVAIDFQRGINEVAEVCRRDAAQNPLAQSPFGGPAQTGYTAMASTFAEPSFDGQSSFAPRQYTDGVSDSPAANPGWTPDGDVDDALDVEMESDLISPRPRGYNQDTPWRSDRFG
jgi:hypothetical protein